MALKASSSDKFHTDGAELPTPTQGAVLFWQEPDQSSWAFFFAAIQCINSGSAASIGEHAAQPSIQRDLGSRVMQFMSNVGRQEMALSNLTDRETEILFDCLHCVTSGEVILNDWEFQTIFGISFSELQRIVDALPLIDEKDETVQLAINNSLNNLLGYPHGRPSKWSTYISVPAAGVAHVFSKMARRAGFELLRWHQLRLSALPTWRTD